MLYIHIAVYFLLFISALSALDLLVTQLKQWA